jgi:hypothetical protein
MLVSPEVPPMMKTARRNAGALMVIAAALVATATMACRAGSSPQSEVSDPACAECPVCKAEGDLACVKVRVRSDTPCSCHCGCTYYFCSEECKKRFEQKPERYLAH